MQGDEPSFYHRSYSIPGHWYRGYYQSSQLCPHAPSSIASKLPCLQVSDPFSPLNTGRQKKKGLNLCCIIIIQYSQRMQVHAVTVIVECPANAKRGTSDNQGILQSLFWQFSVQSLYGAFFPFQASSDFLPTNAVYGNH